MFHDITSREDVVITGETKKIKIQFRRLNVVAGLRRRSMQSIFVSIYKDTEYQQMTMQLYPLNDGVSSTFRVNSFFTNLLSFSRAVTLIGSSDWLLILSQLSFLLLLFFRPCAIFETLLCSRSCPVLQLYIF